MNIARAVLVSLALTLLAGCASQAARDIGADRLVTRKAERDLIAGMQDYEDGNYKSAARRLQGALDEGLTFKSDQLRAYKHLAFVHCISNREKMCREAFRSAFELDPKFELSPAEVGHPLWGPVYQSVRKEMARRAK